MKKETQILKIRGINVSTSINEERRLFHLTAMAGTPIHVKFRSDAGEAIREVLRKRLILNGRLHSAPVSRSGAAEPQTRHPARQAWRFNCHCLQNQI